MPSLYVQFPIYVRKHYLSFDFLNAVQMLYQFCWTSGLVFNNVLSLTPKYVKEFSLLFLFKITFIG